MEVYNIVPPIESTADKNYRCKVCGELIKIGEVYNYRVNLIGRDFIEYRLHSECAMFVEAMNRNNRAQMTQTLAQALMESNKPNMDREVIHLFLKKIK